jgi:hypothetical protein
MAKVTYTKRQLEDFTIKELKTIDLFNEIGFKKGMVKAEIIKNMLKVQKLHESAKKEVVSEKPTPKPVNKIKPVALKDVFKKPSFHRILRKIKRHMH